MPLIGDDDNTFLNSVGAEIERDNFTVNMKQRLGADRGYRISVQKELNRHRDHRRRINYREPNRADIPERFGRCGSSSGNLH